MDELNAPDESHSAHKSRGSCGDSPGAQTNRVLCLFRGHATVQIHTQQACVSQLSSALQAERGPFAIRDPFHACLFAKMGSYLGFTLYAANLRRLSMFRQRIAGTASLLPRPWVTHVGCSSSSEFFRTGAVDDIADMQE